MKLNNIFDLIDEEIILEKRKYEHRKGYEGNKKGSYIEKGKTYWDYSGGATPGNERIVSQIQSKIVKKFDSYASRDKIKSFLKTDKAKNIFKSFKKRAKEKFGSDEDDQGYRGYLYGGFATTVARILSSNKNKGMKYLL